MSKYQSDSINELASALAKAQGEMSHARKAVENSFFKSSYADLPAVIDAAKAALAKHGLSVAQPVISDDQGGMAVMSLLMHSSGQWLMSSYPVRPVKNDPQSVGSAITYGRRYAYASLVGVASIGEDDDGNAASTNGHHHVEPQRQEYSSQPVATTGDSGWKTMVAEAHAMQGLNDFERKFINDMHDRIKQYGDKANPPSEKQMGILKKVLDKKKQSATAAEPDPNDPWQDQIPF